MSAGNGARSVEVRKSIRCTVGLCSLQVRCVRSLVQHMQSIHSFQSTVTIPCRLDGCPSVSCSVDAFRKHLSRYHPRLWKGKECLPERNSLAVSESCAENVYDCEVAPHYSRSPEVGKCQALSSAEAYNQTMAWVAAESLRLRMVTEHQFECPTSMSVQIHNMMCDFTMSALQKIQWLSNLSTFKYDECDIMNVRNALFVGKGRVRRALQQYNYIPPRQVELQLPPNPLHLVNSVYEATLDEDDAMAEVAVNTEEGEEIVDVSSDNNSAKASGIMHYVPILQTLDRYLSHDDVAEDIVNEQVGEQLEKYTSGSLFKSHPIFKDNPHALRIILYTDEFELCNPIGSHRGKHKILGVYYSVGNIQQHYLSHLSSIHLALLCHYSNVEKYSYYEVLKPLIRDLKKLETEGIQVVTAKGKQYFWKGGVAFVCGDNLSQNALGGFRRCFSSGKVSRFCMADYCDLKKILSEKDCFLRTEEGHAVHVQSVLADPSLIPMYGVTGPSPLNALQAGFIVDILPPDVMHDVLECVIVHHLTLLIRGLHRRKVVKLDQMRQLLDSFPLGRNDKRSRHPGVSPKFMKSTMKLIGSASQKLNLFKIFSLAVGPYVAHDDKHWLLYLSFNEICDMVLAPVLELGWLVDLQQKIERHHKDWVKLYPDVAVYKWHSLLHLVRAMVKLGPAKHFWTMRFEAFHLYFKRMAQKLHQFRNITKLLAERFEKRRALELHGENALPPSLKPLGRQSLLSLKEMPQHVANILIAKYDYTPSTPCVVMPGISVRGMKCYVNDFVIIGLGMDAVPIFLKVTNISLIGEKTVMLGWAGYVASWDSHLHAYEIQVSRDVDDFLCIEPCNIVSPQVLDGYCINGKLYVKLNFLATDLAGNEPQC